MALNVGFVGLGNMGEGMASNLAKAGFALTVRDIRPEPVQRLVALGATVASSNYELATRSNLVCVALFDEAQVRSVFLPRFSLPFPRFPRAGQSPQTRILRLRASLPFRRNSPPPSCATQTIALHSLQAGIPITAKC